MILSHLRLVSVPVSDQERAKRFYLDLLGLELRADTPFGDGYRWIEVAPEGADTGFCLATWFTGMAPGSVQGLVLATEDVHAAYTELSARGVEFRGPVQQAPWGPFALFTDPDGNAFLLSEPLAAGPPER